MSDQHQSPMEERLTEGEAAVILGCSTRTLQRYRAQGIGPAYQKRGPRRIRYLRADLKNWDDSCKKSGQ